MMQGRVVSDSLESLRAYHHWQPITVILQQTLPEHIRSIYKRRVCRVRMDELLCDPHLAPQFVQLLNKNLQEARKALEAVQEVRT